MGVPEPWELGVWVQVEKLGLSPRELPKGLEVGASCRAGAGVGRAEAGVVPRPPELLRAPTKGVFSVPAKTALWLLCEFSAPRAGPGAECGRAGHGP